MYRCLNGSLVPVVFTEGGPPMPEDGTCYVIGDESGEGSLWIDWEHHGTGPTDLNDIVRVEEVAGG